MAEDYSAFQPVQEDYSGFTPVVAAGPTPKPRTVAPPKPESRFENIGRGLQGAFNQGVSGNLMIQPIRWAMQAADFGGYKQKLKAKFPGRSDDWYDTQMNKVYNQAITGIRQDAQKQVEDNPYPGHQVGNFAANVLGSADPTWLIAPGASASKNVVGHVAKQAAVQGGLAGVTDLAAQGLDAAAGMENKYDPKRNLEAIAAGGAFGGTFGGASYAIHTPQFQKFVQESNAPEFVKKAFTPQQAAPNPEYAKFESQVGAESAVNTPELQARQREVFSKGTAEDIHNFYNEVGGPKPSEATVQDWLKTRESWGTPIAPKQSTLDAQIHRDTIAEHIANETKTWKNKPKVNVLSGLDDLSPDVKATAIKDGITPDNTVGFLGSDGQVHIFANQVKTPEAASAVLFHEALGHHGLAERFGSKLDTTLNTLVTKNVGQFSKRVDKWQAENPGAYGGNKLRAAEEVLAEMSQEGPLPKSIGDAVVSSVRQFARRMGVDLKYSDAEVSHILAMAHDAVINGKGRDVIANRFGGLNNYQATDFDTPTSRQMYAGMKAKKQPKGAGEWFYGPDGNARFEISDHNAKWEENHSLRKGTADLDEVLIHPELFKQYPELRNIKIKRDNLDEGVQGQFDPNTQTLHMSPVASDPKSVVLHEVQHWIQFKEGWQHGGNSEMFEPHNQTALKQIISEYDRRLARADTDAAEKYFQKKKAKAEDLLEAAPTLNLLRHNIKDNDSKAKFLQGQIDSVRQRIQNYRGPLDDPGYLKLKEQRNTLSEQYYKISKRLMDAEIGLHRIKEANKDIAFDYYRQLMGEVEARDTQARQHMTPQERAITQPFTIEGIQPKDVIMRYGDYDAHQSQDRRMVGEEPVNPSELDEIDQLKQNPRFWSDPEYRRNVIELARAQSGIATEPEVSSIPAPSGFASEAEARAAQVSRQMTPEQLTNFTQASPELHEDIRNRGIKSLKGDIRAYNDDLDVFEQFADENPDLVGKLTREDQRIMRNGDHPVYKTGGSSKFFRAYRDGPEALSKFFKDYNDKVNVLREQVKTLESAKSSGGIFTNLPSWMHHGTYLDDEIAKASARASRQMTPEQLQKKLANGDLDIEHLENTYERVYRDYVPTHRPDREVKMAATAAGFTPAKVKGMKSMEDLSARIYRAQEAAKLLDQKLSVLADKEGTPQWTARDADNARKAIADHNYILTQLYDDKSELGRALRIAKMGYTHADMRAYQEMLAEHGGTLAPLADDETLSRFLKSYKAVSAGGANPNGINALVRGLQKPNWEEYILSARSNMMLSGLSTHVTAITDMIDGIGYDLMDHSAGLIPSLGREGLRALGIPVKPGIHPAEVGARYWGVLRAAMEAKTYVDALHTLKVGHTGNTSGGRQYARIPLVSKIGDAIAAEDQFFRAFATNMHLYGLGVRKAVEEARASGKKPSMDDLITAGSSYARAPDPAMLKEAEDAAQTNLLLGNNILVTPLDALRRTSTLPPGATAAERTMNIAQRAASFAVNFMLPFVRTATNSLYQRVWRRSPLTLLDPRTLADLSTGGIKADVAMGRIILASAATAIAWSAAEKGLTSGEGPDNQAKKALKMAGGWRPKSVDAGDRYNINQNLGNRLNPFDLNSQTATMIASLHDAYKQGANQGQVATGMKMAMYSTLKNLADNAWLGDLSKDVSTFMQPGRVDQKDQWVADQATSFVPALSGQIARVQDQGQPMTTVSGDLGQTIENTLKSKIPGLRETLPDRMTPLGTPVQSGTTIAGQSTGILPQGNRITGGAYINKTTDPAEQEILRLDDFSDKAVVTAVQKTITVDKQKIKLNNQQFSEYQQLAGRNIVENVRTMMATSEWQDMSDEEKATWVNEMQKVAKKEAREQLFSTGEE